MLAPLNHAIVRYEDGASGGRKEVAGEGEEEGRDGQASTGGVGEGGGPRGSPTVGTQDAWAGSEPGGFYFFDGGQKTDFAAALRIRVGEGNREWPLKHVRQKPLNSRRLPLGALIFGRGIIYRLKNRLGWNERSRSRLMSPQELSSTTVG